MEDIEYKIWFSKLNISNNIKKKLLKDFGNIKNIWNVKRKELAQRGYKRINNFKYIRFI